MISLLLSVVRDRGKNLPRYASTSSSHVLTEPYGNDSYHVVAISRKEKGKRLIRATVGVPGINNICNLNSSYCCSKATAV